MLAIGPKHTGTEKLRGQFKSQMNWLNEVFNPRQKYR
jgi:hypothetical protein